MMAIFVKSDINNTNTYALFVIYIATRGDWKHIFLKIRYISSVDPTRSVGVIAASHHHLLLFITRCLIAAMFAKFIRSRVKYQLMEAIIIVVQR